MSSLSIQTNVSSSQTALKVDPSEPLNNPPASIAESPSFAAGALIASTPKSGSSTLVDRLQLTTETVSVPSLTDRAELEPEKPKISVKALDTHLHISISGTKKPERPDYLSEITEGHADNLLNDADMEHRHEPTNTAKGSLVGLGECSCTSLSRTKNPTVRGMFDDVVQGMFREISENSKQISVTEFASGKLFSTFVRTVEMVESLNETPGHKALNINLIDTSYAASVKSELSDMSEETQAISAYEQEIARILPSNIDLSVNVFSSTDAYIQASKDTSIPPHLLIGEDLGGAAETWASGALDKANGGRKICKAALHKIGDKSISEADGAKGYGVPVVVIERSNGPSGAFKLHVNNHLTKSQTASV